MKYYHVTKKDKLESILSHGLIAQIGENSEWMNEPKGVFLFISIKEMEDALKGWMNLIYEEESELVSLEVDLPDEFELDSAHNEWEVRSPEDIPASYIQFFRDERVIELKYRKKLTKMDIANVKDMFKLANCRKSQAKNIHAWYWSFQSLLTDHVQVTVTTYGVLSTDQNEDEAWKELEKAVCVFITPTAE